MYEQEEPGVDFREVLHALRKHIVLIIILTILGGAAGYSYASFAVTPLYKASVQMIVNTRSKDATGNVTNDNINSAKNLVDTYAIIIASNKVLNKVIDELNLDTDYVKLAKRVSVSSVNSTPIMEVSLRHEDPEKAGEIIECISRLAPDMIVEAVDAGSCRVVSDVQISSKPVSPSVKKYALLGVAGGLALSVLIAILRMLLHNTIVDEEDVTKYLGLPVLGVIPEISEEYHG